MEADLSQYNSNSPVRKTMENQEAILSTVPGANKGWEKSSEFSHSTARAEIYEPDWKLFSSAASSDATPPHHSSALT